MDASVCWPELFSSVMPKSWKVVALITLGVCSWSRPSNTLAQPGPVYWSNPNGGDYMAAANWSSGTSPQSYNSAIFDLGGHKDYVVTSSSWIFAPERLAVNNDLLTLNLQSPWILSGGSFSALHIGTLAGNLSRLSLQSGFLDFNELRVGHNGGRGLLSLDGPAASLSIFDPGFSSSNLGLHVGLQGDGAVRIREGAKLLVAAQVTGAFLPRLYVGAGLGGTGLADISGYGSRLTADGLTVGLNGRGALNVIDSANVLLNDALYVADGAGPQLFMANGSLEIEGLNSKVSSTRQAQIGRNGGYGSLVITNGGRLETRVGNSTTGTSGIIATLNTATTRSRGDVFIAGQDSRWDNDGLLVVGFQGDANVRLRRQGTITSLRAHVGRNTGAVGVVQLANAGTLWKVDQDLNLGGTELAPGGRAEVVATDYAKVSVGSHLRLWSNATLDVATQGIVTVGVPTNPVALGTITIGTGGVLSGSGSITGDVVVENGLLSPGSALGTLAIDGDLNVASSGRVLFEIGGIAPGAGFDRIYHTGAASIAGIIQVSLVNGFIPQSGNQFKLFSGPGSLDYSAATFQLPPGITVQSLFPGSLVVVAIPEPTAIVALSILVLTATTIRRRPRLRPGFSIKCGKSLLVLLTITICLTPRFGQAAKFQGIPGLIGATAISSDGRHVAGIGLDPEYGRVASRWEYLEGVTNLKLGTPYAISLDGRTVLVLPPESDEGSLGSYVVHGAGHYPPHAAVGGGSESNGEHLNSLTDDGFTIVGGNSAGPRKFETLELLSSNDLRGQPLIGSGSATAVSADGRYILTGGVLFKDQSQIVPLPGLTGFPHGLSPNAKTISGTGPGGNFLYNLTTGVQKSFAGAGAIMDVSDNGRAVGIAQNGTQVSALYWDDGLNAPLDMKVYLENQLGIGDEVLNGWTLSTASAISADGRILAGSGINPQGQSQAWIADLTKPVVLNFGQSAPGAFVPDAKASSGYTYEKNSGAVSLGAKTISLTDRSTLITKVQEIFDRSGIKNIEVTDVPAENAVNIFFAAIDRPSTSGDVSYGVTPAQFRSRLSGDIVSGTNRHAESSTGYSIVFPAAFNAYGGLEHVAETIAHEAGHALGLMHVNPSNPDDSTEVMDYDAAAGHDERFINAPTAIVDYSTDPLRYTAFTSNPVFGLRYFIDGIPAATLESEGTNAGDWEQPTKINVKTELYNIVAGDQQIYDVKLSLNSDSLGDGVDQIVATIPITTLVGLESALQNLPFNTSLQLYAASQPGGAYDIDLMAVGATGQAAFSIPLTGRPTDVVLSRVVAGGARVELATATLRASFNIAGDFDDDGDVDRDDFLVWRSTFGSSGAGLSSDGNRNGIVDAADYVIWRHHFGEGSAAVAANTAVPEPATAFLLLAAGAFFFVSRECRSRA